jgi:hypothetical protein
MDIKNVFTTTAKKIVVVFGFLKPQIIKNLLTSKNYNNTNIRTNLTFSKQTNEKKCVE